MTKVLFIYLKAFSFTGGIEKFNRSFLKALNDLSNDDLINPAAISLYDSSTDEKYFPSSRFKGYSGSKLSFIFMTIFNALTYDIVILGHINLAIIGVCIRKMRPSTKIIIIAHGIEAWEKQTGVKAKILEQSSWIFSVSNFTKRKILEANPTIDPDKIRIFPNTLDPYFQLPKTFEKPSYLLKRYGLTGEDKILLTVARLSKTEKFKGYEQVLKVLPSLRNGAINLKYLLSGKSDIAEARRINDLIQEYGLESNVILTGYLNDEELQDHYLLTDLFIMPSKKEGFGIVFIEALACGKKVIAGYKDGSVDALQNGALGQLIDPDSVDELRDAILKGFQIESDPERLQKSVLGIFGFQEFRARLREFIVGR